MQFRWRRHTPHGPTVWATTSSPSFLLQMIEWCLPGQSIEVERLWTDKERALL